MYTRALGTRTNYDEGVYLASLDAMRRGQELGAELYTSQPPVFYWLLRALAAPFGSSIPDIRVAFALLAIVGVAAAIALGWRLYGPPAGVAAGALVAIGPPYPSVAPTVSADVPAVALGLVSLALVAFALRSGPRPWAGAVLALAVLTKLLALPFVVPFLALALAARRRDGFFPPPSSAPARGADRRRRQCRRAGRHLAPGRDRPHRREEPRDPLGEPRPDPQASRAPDSVRLARAAGLPRVRPEPSCTTDLAAVDVRARRGVLVLVRPLADHHLVLLSVACAIAAGPASRSRSGAASGPAGRRRCRSRALRRCRDVPGAATPASERHRRRPR